MTLGWGSGRGRRARAEHTTGYPRGALGQCEYADSESGEKIRLACSLAELYPKEKLGADPSETIYFWHKIGYVFFQ